MGHGRFAGGDDGDAKITEGFDLRGSEDEVAAVRPPSMISESDPVIC